MIKKIIEFNKKHYSRIFLLLLLLGILSSMLYRFLEKELTYFSIKDLYNQSLEIDSLKSQIDTLTQRKKDLLDQIQKFSISLEDAQLSYEDLISSEIDNARAIAGLTKLEGPGVVILVSDATRDLQENEDPNNLLIHDIDIRVIVDDLRNAGAEAISVNGQRIIYGKSEIVCIGPTIQIGGVAYAAPFIIKAIGDKQTLAATINAPGSFTESLRQYGVHVEVNTSVNVEIPAFNVGN